MSDKEIQASVVVAVNIVYLLCACTLCFVHGRITALHYDRMQPHCPYWTELRGHNDVIGVASFAYFIVAVVVSAANDSPIPSLVCLVQIVFQWCALASLFSRRYRARRRIISARYMQHKYGIDFDALLRLLDKHELRSFPIVYFENAMNLSAEERNLYTVTAEQRETMRAAVQCEFIDPLARPKPSLKRLALYKTEYDSNEQCNKLERITTDYYAKHASKK